jgi:hypothetical protein
VGHGVQKSEIPQSGAIDVPQCEDKRSKLSQGLYVSTDFVVDFFFWLAVVGFLVP